MLRPMVPAPIIAMVLISVRLPHASYPQVRPRQDATESESDIRPAHHVAIIACSRIPVMTQIQEIPRRRRSRAATMDC